MQKFGPVVLLVLILAAKFFAAPAPVVVRSSVIPEPGLLALLGGGFLLALLGLGLFAFQGLDKAGKVSARRGQIGLALFAIGAACWTLAAYKA